MGAISDWVNMNNKGRLGAWLFAIAIAMVCTLILETSGVISLVSTIPPYRTTNFSWLRYTLGGFMFGIGMVMAGGCGNKTLVNIGSGNLKSLIVFIMAAIMSYLMTKTQFYEILFHPMIQSTTINLNQYNSDGQSLHQLAGGLFHIQNTPAIHWLIVLTASCITFFTVFRIKHFHQNWKNIAAGLSIGIVVSCAWWLTGGEMGQQLIEDVSWMDERPISVGVQSYTFINPMGETIAWLLEPQNPLLISFGMIAVFGMIAGAFIMSLMQMQFKLIWFTSIRDFMNHAIGGMLMGMGGILAMGCTIGQAVSGISTLSLGSIITLIMIILGATLTLKIQYYQILYEDEASFFSALVSALADMKLIPSSLRKLDPP